MFFLAAEGNPVVVQIMPLVTAIVVFGVAFFILRATVWPKITQGLDDRAEKIRNEIRSAEEAREQAKAAQAEYEQSLQTARQEAAEMISSAKASAKAAAAELRSQNEADLVELKQRANRDIEAARLAAVAEIYSEAADLAAAIASKVLQRQISVEDQQRLVDESLSELQPVTES